LPAIIPPPPTYIYLIPSAFNSFKDNFTPDSPPYSAASAAKDIALRGFLLPHNKVGFGLKAIPFGSQSVLFESESVLFDSQSVLFESESVDFDSESVDFDSESVDFDSESVDFDSQSMDFDSQSMDFNLKSTDFDLKSTPYIFRNKHAILPCGRFAPRKEKNILRAIHVS
jgi:hypothetical protein